MELAVIGAGGRTGRLVVEKALRAGHEVTAYVRRPDAVSMRHERLSVAYGDVMDASGVYDVIAGKDAVVLILGVTNRRTTTVFSAGVTNVLNAMEAKGVHRLVTVSCGGLDIGRHMPLRQRLVAEYIIERRLRNIYLDLARMEDELELSDSQWTVIRPARLADSPASGTCRTNVGGPVNRPKWVSRADLASYIVSHIDDPETWRTKVAISQ